MILIISKLVHLEHRYFGLIHSLIRFASDDSYTRQTKHPSACSRCFQLRTAFDDRLSYRQRRLTSYDAALHRHCGCDDDDGDDGVLISDLSEVVAWLLGYCFVIEQKLKVLTEWNPFRFDIDQRLCDDNVNSSSIENRHRVELYQCYLGCCCWISIAACGGHAQD